MVSKATFELFHTYRHINLAKQQLEELLRNTKGYPLIKNIARQQLIKINHIISSLTVYLSLKDLEILNKGMLNEELNLKLESISNLVVLLSDEEQDKLEEYLYNKIHK